MIETEGLTHLHLFVADLDRSLGFYRGVFGLQEMSRESPKMVFLRGGPSFGQAARLLDPAPR